jgi:DNA polymerase-3 subunit epsilon
MRNHFERLDTLFRKGGGEIGYEEFDRVARSLFPLEKDPATILLLLQASGYPITESSHGYRLETYFTPWREQEFCVLDIETNGSKPGYSQVIEIGALKLENGQVTDRFETFVSCAYLPEHITLLTGIEPSDLKDAPTRAQALSELKLFMGNAVFTAHNAKFDYGFLDASFDRFGLGHIANPVLCTIDLAKRTIESEKYGLAYLNERLDLGMVSHHRAYDDALAASKILRIAMENIPDYVVTTDELLRFSKSSSADRKRMASANELFEKRKRQI